jgi:hypothetical protein
LDEGLEKVLDEFVDEYEGIWAPTVCDVDDFEDEDDEVLCDCGWLFCVINLSFSFTRNGEVKSGWGNCDNSKKEDENVNSSRIEFASKSAFSLSMHIFLFPATARSSESLI